MGGAPIGRGDYVECVMDAPCPTFGPISLRAGSVYVVEDVQPDVPNIYGASLLIAGHRSRAPRGGFGFGRFKPIYKRDESLTARLLSDIPTDAPASPEEVVA